MNLRDSQAELAPNESPDLWNVTLDERGGVAKRLGYAKVNAAPYDATALVQASYYWATGRDQITQVGKSLYKGLAAGPAFYSFSTADRCDFADFAGKLWIVHPVDGVFQSDGTGAGTAAVAGSPKGSTIIPWQNRLLVAGDPANPPRLYASAIGDGTDWALTAGHGWTNDLREKDSELILCLASASGIDIAGRPGLIACKRDSTYRIYDSETGAYQTLDPNVGAASSLSVTNLFGRTIVLSRSGIYWSDGVNSLQKASARVDPLFAPGALAEDQLDLCAAGALGDRCYFSLPRAGKTANDLALEYHPIEGWITAGSNAASCYSVYADNAQRLLTGSPTVNGQLYEQLKTGSDDGAPIASYFQSRWYEPADGFLARMRRLSALGRGSYQLYVRTDYETGQGIGNTIELPQGGFTWNDPAAVWNDPQTVWGPNSYLGYSDPIFSLGTCRSVAFRVEETSMLSSSAPPILNGGVAPEAGAWGLAGLDLLYVQLGIA